MWKKWKQSEFYKKMKEVRVSRAVYVSTVIILLSLAVVLTITIATNRAKRDEAESALPPVNDATTGDNAPVTRPPVSSGDETDTPTASKIPELALPVSGKLAKGHSVDTQVFSPTLGEYRVHLGVDIMTSAGAPVCAAAAGTVERIWQDPMMGWSVAISHDGDCVTVYKNLSKDLAEGLTVGARVQKGELLGSVGDTAVMEIAEEPHLHMEMTVKGLQVDPLEYFSKAVLATLGEDSVYEDEAGDGK